MKTLVLTFLAGLGFGIGLAVSGMTDPGRVIGFLDIGGAWDPTLAFVMGGALMVFAPGLWLLRKVRDGRGWFGTVLPSGESAPIRKELIGGAAVFGVGWGLGGFCPGPAIANLAAMRVEVLVFIPFMVVGMWLARRSGGG